ncbi:MAG: DUF5615 family PIN-like protein [Bacteroidia bacterium]|nr:DUF5615 family PIN-like protein [Bacteroidia bacterium]
MIRLYADENFPMPVILKLRGLGYDIITVQEDSRSGDEDLEVLRRALLLRRWLITLDRKDFKRMHLSGITHSGIIACTFNPDFDDFAQKIHRALSAIDLSTPSWVIIRR